MYYLRTNIVIRDTIDNIYYILMLFIKSNDISRFFFLIVILFKSLKRVTNIELKYIYITKIIS